MNFRDGQVDTEPEALNPCLALRIDPQHKYARVFVQKLKDIKEHRQSVEQIPFDSIPVLQISVNELTGMTLDAQEGFVLSRLNGEWDVSSIVKLCPMTEQHVLIILRRLLDDGIIELKENSTGVVRRIYRKHSRKSGGRLNQIF